jgi:hypothetical protein
VAEIADPKQPRRGPGRKFGPGQSGNPAGKPAGTRNRATLAIEALMEGEAKALGRKAVEMALAGDAVAMRLCFERIAPVRRGRPVKFTLPRIATAADVTAALGAVLKATATGEMTPDEAATIAGVMEAKRRAIETEELDQRLSNLEKSAAKGKRL